VHWRDHDDLLRVYGGLEVYERVLEDVAPTLRENFVGCCDEADMVKILGAIISRAQTSKEFRGGL
jgi:hypothetical protein